MSPPPGAGRYAPSPSGDLHLGNLRTALLAWLFARTEGRAFLLRIEDMDRVRPGAEARQLRDLARLGITFDPPAIRQTDRLPAYERALASLSEQGLVYECFCTRREISEAASAPHHTLRPDGAYPGTCRTLTPGERAARRTLRPAALRLRVPEGVVTHTVTDRLAGEVTAMVDDLVLRRNDGVYAYNLAVVIDDAFQQVGQVVRGDDLLTSAPRQAYLAGLLGLPIPEYVHVPLVVAPSGTRLAKRDGAVTLADLAPHGWTPDRVRSLLAVSLGLAGPGEAVTMEDLAARFDPGGIPREPWRVDPAALT
ncbi:MAG: tRNA glutamyl-Q(34) synthetase GluQRS [bacterium]|nr:tRNA glutamyl-Q(34) synthetase GluQRS [bacterium]